MRTQQKLTLLKFVAVAAAGYYLYHLTKAQGGNLGTRFNPDKIAGLGAQLFPAEYRPYVQQLGSAFIKRKLS